MLSREYLVLNIADNTVFNRYIGTPLGVDLTQFKVLPYNGEDISTQGLVNTLAASYNEISIQRLKKIVQSEKIANEYLAKGVVYTFPDTIQAQIDCSSAELISDLALKSNLAKQLLDEGVGSGVLTMKDANGRYHTMTPAQYIDLSLFITKRTEKIDAVLGAIYNELQALVTVPDVQAYNVALRFDFLQADAGTNSLIKNTVLNKATTKVDLSSYPGLVQALGFKTASGTLSQFLKADGSLDSKAYLPLTTATASVPIGSPMATDSILGIDSAGNVVRSTVTGGSGGQGGSVGWVLKSEYTVDLPAISQNMESSFNVTVTGASLKDTVVITPPSTLPRYVLVVGTVTATDTVTVILRNLGSYHDQSSSVFTIAVIKDASYLPAASDTVAGLIKVGSGLAIDGSGVLSSTGGGGGTTLNGTGFVSMSGATPSYISGTASQFLKADGSLDSSAYVTQSSIMSSYTAGSNTALANTDSLVAALGKIQGQLGAREAAIASGTAAQFWCGDKSWQTLNTAAVPESGSLYYTNARGIGSTLTGYVKGAGTVVAADSILQAIQKLDGNLTSVSSTASAAFPSAGGTINGFTTLNGNLQMGSGNRILLSGPNTTQAVNSLDITRGDGSGNLFSIISSGGGANDVTSVSLDSWDLDTIQKWNGDGSSRFYFNVEMPSVKITTGAGAGKVLTSDASGAATWQTPAAGGYTLPAATAGTLGGIKIGSGLSIDGAGVVSAAGGGGPSGFTIVATSSAVTAGSRLLVDTVAAAIVLTLPVAPAAGDCIELVDAGLGGSFAVNKCTVAGNGKTIQGLAEDMDVTDAGASVGLVYNGTEWRLF